MMRRLILLAVPAVAALLTIGGTSPAVATTAPAGYVAGWGYNAHYDLGAGYKGVGSTVPVSALVSGAVEIGTGGEWGAARLANGTVSTWGGNESGQTGSGQRTPYKAQPSVVPGLSGVAEISVNAEQILARLTNGTVASWGANLFGQQCDGESGSSAAVVRPRMLAGITSAVQVATGGGDSLVLLADGTVLACGEDKKSEFGDAPGMKKALTVVKGLSGIKQIAVGGMAAGGAHVLALTRQGTVLGLGMNGHGELGDGTIVDRATPVAVKGLSNVKAISAGPEHNLALLNDGTVVGWGQDGAGQLGAPAPAKCGPRVLSVACALLPQPVPGLTNVSKVVAGRLFSLVLKEGRAYSFGKNVWWTLGDGTTENKPQPVPVAGGLTGVTDLAGGYFNAFAVTATQVSPEASITPGPGSLTISWLSTDLHSQWYVAIRPANAPVVPFGSSIHLGPSARSYTFRGLTPGKAYEVKVGSTSVARKIAFGSAG
jgi:alpha-tubulin suppressor-like RCC1 family protein